MATCYGFEVPIHTKYWKKVLWTQLWVSTFQLIFRVDEKILWIQPGPGKIIRIFEKSSLRSLKTIGEKLKAGSTAVFAGFDGVFEVGRCGWECCVGSYNVCSSARRAPRHWRVTCSKVRTNIKSELTKLLHTFAQHIPWWNSLTITQLLYGSHKIRSLTWFGLRNARFG